MTAHRRPFWLVFVGALLVASASIANAAPKAACRLLVDARGDEDSWTGPAPRPGDPPLDILSGDIATNSKRVAAVVRAADITTEDPNSPGGTEYWFYFIVGETKFFLAGQRITGSERDDFRLLVTTGRAGNEQASAESLETIGQIAGVIDEARNEVRMWAPLSMFAQYHRIVPGAVLRDLRASTFRRAGNPHTEAGPARVHSGGLGVGSDHAESDKTYKAGSPSCLGVPR